MPGVAEDCGCVHVGMESPAPGGAPTVASVPTETTPSVATETPAGSPSSGTVVAFNARMLFTAVGLSAMVLIQLTA
jgi:hypothetical protein